MSRPLLTLSEIPEGPSPLYERIADQLRARIEAGVWGGGQQLKAEGDLAADLGVARGTLRKAIGVLVDSGHLVQRHGIGTFISQRRGVELGGRFESLGERMTRGGMDFRTAVLERELLADDDAFGGPVLRLSRLRSTSSGPVSVLANAVPLALAPGLETADLSATSLYGLLDQLGVSIARAELTFSAVPADARAAELLDVPERSPLLHFTQTTYGTDDRVIDQAETWIRPDRHQPSVTLWRSN